MTRYRFLIVCFASTSLTLSVSIAKADPLAETAGQVERPDTASEVISVISHSLRNAGGGLMIRQNEAKGESRVGQQYISKIAPASNPLQMISLLPGVNMGTSDPYGMSSRSDISIHGLDQTEIGFTLEGMPAADFDLYLPFSETYADAENISHITVSQETTDLTAPVINGVGGLISTTLRDPSEHFGGTVDASWGTFKADREFARIDTGLIGNSGIKAFASFSDTQANNFRGSGRNHRTHIDFKAVKEWGQGNRVALVMTANWFSTYRSSILTLDNWRKYGASSNYASTYAFGETGYYKNYIYNQREFHVTAPSEFQLTDQLSAAVTPYFFTQWGPAPGGTTLNTTGNYNGTQPLDGPLVTPYQQNGTITALAQDNVTEYAGGINANLSYHTKHNTVTLGYWYGYFDDAEYAPFQAINFSGETANNGDKYFLKTASGQTLTAQDTYIQSQTNAIYLGDTLGLLNDKLSISAGLKYVMISNRGVNNLPGPQHYVGASTAQPLPRFSIMYHLPHHQQIFANASASFRLPTIDPTYFNFYNISNGSISQLGQPKTKDEYAISEELGYRYQGDFNFSITLFNTNITNRQINSIISRNGSLLQATVNGGGETLRGIDVELGLRPWHHFSPYFSGEFLHATIDNNLLDGGDYLPTAGKTAVRAPKFQGSIGLAYDDGLFFGQFGLRYVDTQYSTFMNDQSMPAYLTADLGAGIHLPSWHFVKSPTLKLNLMNIGDAKYLSSIASPSMTAKGATGVHGTTISGSNPLYYEGAPFSLMMTASTNF